VLVFPSVIVRTVVRPRMEQEMTTRPSIRPQDIVAPLSGGVGADTAARVECDLYLIATPVAAACACERRNITI